MTVPLLPSPDISRIACSNRGYGRPSGRPRVSAPATYRSGTPQNQSRGTAGRVARHAAQAPALRVARPSSWSRDSNS